METTLEDLAANLSFILKEEIHVENDCIVLGGVGPGDYAFLQIGANDGRLYLSAPIMDIDEDHEMIGQYLSTLMELNGDTKNYPHARVAYNAMGGSAHWIELIEEGLSAQALVQLIQERGQFIAQIRHALNTTQIAEA
jgi:hypothetical protein